VLRDLGHDYFNAPTICHHSHFKSLSLLNRIAFLSLSFAFSICLAPRAGLAASDQIGLTVVVKNDVSQVEPKIIKLKQGDDVIRDEVIRTLADSQAKFVLKDDTNLMLGPNSRIKLDKAVFTDEKTAGDIAIKLTEGSFRFITGHSLKESYAITTPLATIGIRGTTLDFFIETLKNTVVLKDGQSRVCAGTRCVELLMPGDTAVIGANGNIEKTTSTDSFNCSGMCSPTTFAQAFDALTTGSIGGGGGGGGGGTGNIPTGGANAGGGLNGGPTGTTNAPGLLLGGGVGGGGGFSQVSRF
jgi:hypothetical protein